MKHSLHGFRAHTIFFFIIVIAALLLSSCQGVLFQARQPAESPTLNPPTNTVKPTVTATLTPTLDPTDTPTLTPTITLMPTPISTPLPWAETAISPENTGQLVLLTQWGRGSIVHGQSLHHDRILIQSTAGLYLFSDSTDELLAEYPGAVKFLVSPDQTRAAILFPDMTIQLILLEDASLIHTYPSQGPIPGYLCEGCDEFAFQSMTRWAAERGGMAFSQDGRYLACGYANRSIGVWDNKTGDLKATLYHDVAGNASQIVFTHDGQHIASIGSSIFEFTPSRLTYWSIEEQKMLWYLNTSGSLDPILISPDNRLFGYYSSGIRLLNPEDGSLIAQINGFASQKPYSPDSTLFISSKGGTIKIEQVQPKYVHLWTIYTDLQSANAEFSPDGSQIIVNGGEKVYSVPDFKLLSEGAPAEQEEPIDPTADIERWLAHGFGDQPRGIVMMAENRLYLWGGLTSVWRWNPLTDQMDWIDFSSEPQVQPVISADGMKAAACFADHLEIRSFSGEELIIPVNCPRDSVLAFVPGRDVLAVGRGTRIATYDISTGEHIQDFIGSGEPIAWLRFSPDGSHFASGSRVCGYGGCRGDQHLWQLEPPKGLSLVSEESDKAVEEVAFASDGEEMISSKGYIWLWRIDSGLLDGKFPIFGSQLAVTPDDRLVAVSQWNGDVMIVALATRQVMAQFRAHTDGILDMAFTPDGANLITLGLNGSLKVWGVR